MTLDHEQRDVAARILAELTPLEPSKRAGALALVVQTLAKCGAASPPITTTQQTETRR